MSAMEGPRGSGQALPSLISNDAIALEGTA